MTKSEAQQLVIKTLLGETPGQSAVIEALGFDGLAELFPKLLPNYIKTPSSFPKKEFDDRETSRAEFQKAAVTKFVTHLEKLAKGDP